MDGECFLNSCFYAKQEKTNSQTLNSIKHEAAKKYADPKLNAECQVNLQRLPKNFEKFYHFLKFEEEKTKIVSKKKPQRKKVPIKGRRRLLELSESDDEGDLHTEERAINDHVGTVAFKKSSEFVTEKSLNTPEGLCLIQRTTSSTENDKIKTLTEFKEKFVETITLSSDDEEDSLVLSSRKSNSTDAESNIGAIYCNTPSMPTHSNIMTPAATEEKKELSKATDEKLQDIVNRIKPKEKLTKLTTPKRLNNGQGKTIRNESNSFKKKKSNSMRKKIQEDPNWRSYCASVNEANQRNGSYVASSNLQHVSTIGIKPHEPIPTYKPSVPQQVTVKTKSTLTSRNDKFTNDFIKSNDMPIKEKKEPKAKRFSKSVLPPKETTKKNSAATTTESIKRKRQENEATDLLAKSESVPIEISLSFKPTVKRVARSNHGQPTKRHTASAKANLALNSAIPNLGRLPDGSFGKKMHPTYRFQRS